MKYKNKIVDRQVGRNAQLFAQAISELEDAGDRYPYLRILVSIVEQAHPEWNQVSEKEEQVANLVTRLSQDNLDREEVKEVVRVRDAERKKRR